MKIIEETLEFFERFTREKCNGNLREASRRLEIPYMTLYDWMVRKRRKPTLKALEEPLSKLNIRLAFPDSQMLDYVFLPCGFASLNPDNTLHIEENGTRPMALEKSWLGEKVMHPENALLVEVTDDTMEPLLKKGSLALVDSESVIPFPGLIYLTSHLGELAFRKISRRPDGFMLHSLDPYTPDTPAQPEHLTVRGQVILTINPL